MIKYQLQCESDHSFEGWFRSSKDFDVQADNGQLECPVCGASDVRKAIMAPAIGKSGKTDERKIAEAKARVEEAMGRARAYVEQNYDYVGDQFSDEARRIHYGESEERGIYGEASVDDAKALIDEGISVAPLPNAAKSPKSTAASKQSKPSSQSTTKGLPDAVKKKLN